MKTNNKVQLVIKLVIAPILLLLSNFKVEGQVYSLPMILDSISKNNIGLQQFALGSKSDQAMSVGVKAWPAPEVGFGLSEFPYGKGDPMMTRKMPMLRIEQMFPNSSKQNAQAHYYQSLTEQNKDRELTLQNILFSKAKASYYQGVIALKKEGVVNEQLSLLSLLIKVIESRIRYNKADLATLYNAQSRLADLQTQLIQLDNIDQQSVIELNTLMNRPMDKDLSIDTLIVLHEGGIPGLKVDTAFVSKNRSDIHFFDHSIKSLQWQYQATAAEAKPTFGVTFDNMRMPNNMYMYSVMAMVSIPVFPWASKGYHSKKEALGYQMQAIEKEKQNRMIEAVGSVLKKQTAIAAQEKDIQLFKSQILPAFQKTYQSHVNALAENEGDAYKALMSWNDLTNKKMEYLDKLSAWLQLKVELENELQIK